MLVGIKKKFGEFICQKKINDFGMREIYSPDAKFVSTIKFNTLLILEFERPFEAGWTFLLPESSSYQG